jgi:hypothetical protein
MHLWRRPTRTALAAHAAWYIWRFGKCKPEWYVFPAGKGQPSDPTPPVTTLRTAWTNVRDKAKVVGRWHTLVTELSESGAAKAAPLNHPFPSGSARSPRARPRHAIVES